MPAGPGQYPLRIAFAGTPDFSVPALKGMIAEGYPPLVVLTQPDRKAGRGRALKASPVKQQAIEAGIPVWQPERLSGEEIQSDLKRLNLDLMIVVAYGQILPQAVLDIPRYGCWNIHASLLPRWRGAAPIQRAIEAGDAESGVSIMQMAAGLDTGPVFLMAETDIESQETGGSLHDRLAKMGVAALLDCLDMLNAGNMPEPVAQNPEDSTYASKLDKSEAEIDWKLPAAQLERKIRAFNPWPVCWFELEGQRIRIFAAEVFNAAPDLPPGSVIAASAVGIDVLTGDGGLRLLEIQAAGGKRMSAADYLNAHPIRINSEKTKTT
jgi:methionyl-tRNA formyltransferase